MNKIRKILITGGNGFIGRNLKEGLATDCQIIAPSSKELDLLNADQVRAYLAGSNFDAVIHCATHNASRNSAKDTSFVLKNNLRMFFNLARGSEFYGKMIYFGSGAEYNRTVMPPQTKEDFFGQSMPTDDYGFSKYVSQLHAEKSENIYNLTIFGCFGKQEDWQIRFISNMICKAMFNLPLTMKQNVFFDYLYVDDLIKVVKYFIEAEKLLYHKYNICTGQSVDLLSLAKLVLQAANKDLKIQVAQEGLGREYSGNNQRLLGEIGKFEFTPNSRAISELYRWYEGQKESIDQNLLLTDK